MTSSRKNTSPFGFDINLSGARVIATNEVLSTACLADAEIDYHLQNLKSHLDAVGKRMKKAVRDQEAKPIWPE